MVDQEKPVEIDLNAKVSDLTVRQLFNLMDALVQKTTHVTLQGIAKAQGAHAEGPKIITPNFTPKSAARYAKRHPDA